MFLYILSFCFLLLLLFCTHKNTKITTTNELVNTTRTTPIVEKKDTSPYFQDLDQTDIVKELQEKQIENKPLVILAFYPLGEQKQQNTLPTGEQPTNN